MAHVDPEILAQMALGDSEQDQQFAHHLSSCHRCQAELQQLTSVAETARALGRRRDLRLQSPADSVWAGVLQEVNGSEGTGSDAPASAADSAKPLVLAEGPPPGHPAARPGWSPQPVEPVQPSRPAWWRRTAVAVAAGLVLGAGGAAVGAAVAGHLGRGASAQHVVGTSRLHPLPQFPQWRAASATATLRTTPAGKVLTISLAAAARRGFFEVWLLGRDGRSMISLGDLTSSHTGQFGLPAGVDLRFYSRIDVSLQQFNGSPVHSAISVVRGNLPGRA